MSVRPTGFPSSPLKDNKVEPMWQTPAETFHSPSQSLGSPFATAVSIICSRTMTRMDTINTKIFCSIMAILDSTWEDFFQQGRSSLILDFVDQLSCTTVRRRSSKLKPFPIKPQNNTPVMTCLYLQYTRL